MALLTVKNVSGEVDALGPVAASTSDTAPHSGDLKWYVKNASGGSVTLTVVSQTPCSFGVTHTAHDKVVTIAAGAEKIVPVGDAKFKHPSTGLVTVTLSSATSVTVSPHR